MSGINLNNSVTNQNGAPSINENTLANRPSPGQPGRLFVDTTNNLIYRDTGSAWVQLAVSAGGLPGGSDTYVQYNQANAFAGDSNFVYNYSSQQLNLGGGFTPGFQFVVNGGSVYNNISNANARQFIIGGTSVVSPLKGTFYVADGGTINGLMQNVTALNSTTTLSYGTNFYVLTSAFLAGNQINLPRINNQSGYVFTFKNLSLNTISIFQNAFDSGFYAVNATIISNPLTIASGKTTTLMADTNTNTWIQTYLS